MRSRVERRRASPSPCVRLRSGAHCEALALYRRLSGGRRWADFLNLDEAEIPTFRDWPALLGALAEINRWLWRAGVDGLGDYLRASEARQLTERLRPRLTRAGVSIQEHGVGVAYWPSFVATVENALR